MEQVLQCYGKGIAAGIVLIAVMVLLFAGIRDEQGNRGLINIVKTWIPEEETITENAAIDAFAEAGEVAYPTIRYAYNGMLHRGAYLPGDLFSAVDGMGEERSVLWCEMTDPHGNSCTIESQQGEVVFDVEGIYTVRVCATDEANRRSVCEFQIPVRRQKAGKGDICEKCSDDHCQCNHGISDTRDCADDWRKHEPQM